MVEMNGRYDHHRMGYIIGCIMYNDKLVGGLEHFTFFHILGIIIPTDFHIFQRSWNHQPAVNHCKWWWDYTGIKHLCTSGDVLSIHGMFLMIFGTRNMRLGGAMILASVRWARSSDEQVRGPHPWVGGVDVRKELIALKDLPGWAGWEDNGG